MRHLYADVAGIDIKEYFYLSNIGYANFVIILSWRIIVGRASNAIAEQRAREAELRKIQRQERLKAEKKEREGRKYRAQNNSQLAIDFDNTVKDYIKQRRGKETVSHAIGWIGGKQKIAKKLISMFPAHSAYAEVFFGGGGVFFNKPKVEYNVINDINSNLTNMYIIMRDKADQFWNYAHYFLYSKDLFKLCYEKYKSVEWKDMSDVQRAVIFYFLIRTSYNKNVNAGHMSKDQSYSIWDEYHRVIGIGERLQNVFIDNRSYREFIENVLKLTTTSRRKTLFYLDPPYVIAEKTDYYEYLFSTSEHSDLAYRCDDINKQGHYFMLSYEDTQIVRDLYRNYEISSIEFSYSMATGSGKAVKKGKEIIVTNYKVPSEQLSLIE